MIPRTFAAYQALARRPMLARELQAALGCTPTQAFRAAQSLCETGQVRRRTRPGCKGYVYEVAR